MLWKLCDGFEPVLKLLLDVPLNIESVYNRWYIYYNCTAYIEFFKQILNITYRNNFKTNLFTKLMGLCCAVEEQTCLFSFVKFKVNSHPVHNWWKTQAHMTKCRVLGIRCIPLNVKNSVLNVWHSQSNLGYLGCKEFTWAEQELV